MAWPFNFYLSFFWRYLATNYAKKGQHATAAHFFRKCLKINNSDKYARHELGLCLLKLGEFSESGVQFQKLLNEGHQDPIIYWNYGISLCELEQFELAFAAFKTHAQLTAQQDVDFNGTKKEGPHKKAHDVEQLSYLHQHLDKISSSTSKEEKPQLGPNNFYIEPCPRLSVQAINSGLDAVKLQEEWQHQSPQIIIVDEFLSPTALKCLNEFCLSSTIWQKQYEGGYLGAMPEHGIGTPLLAQIAEELKEKLPNIFGPYPLRHYWGFKYDRNGGGIGVHADPAMVNVNFWLTPDEANLDPLSGGLVVWNVPAPPDWNFNTYNTDIQKIRSFLIENNAIPIKIPYKANRAVIFNSNLFHETDYYLFKNGYENRRINMTLLFGKQNAKKY